MNTIATFRKCTLTDEELVEAIDKATDAMYKRTIPSDYSPPSRHIPARPNEDYDLLVGELLLRFREIKGDFISNEKPIIIPTNDPIRKTYG